MNGTFTLCSPLARIGRILKVDSAIAPTTLTRLGFAARGLLCLIIATVVLKTGHAGDPAGALEYLGDGGGGGYCYL